MNDRQPDEPMPPWLGTPEEIAGSVTTSTDGPAIVAVSPHRREADDWCVVLASQGISSRLGRAASGGWTVTVDAAARDAAVATLTAYASENREPPPARGAAATPLAAALAGVAAVAGFVAAFVVTGPADRMGPWIVTGGADAAAIRHGEIWRAVTALGLHADLGHLAANALAGLLFFSLACAAAGAGPGLLLVVVSGAAGNLANAWVHPAGHLSVGASTAVFGAVGVLAGLRLMPERALPGRGGPAWMPVAAGVALLALLGSGEQTDVLAHLLGFAAGVLLGLMDAALGIPRSTKVQVSSAAIVFGIVAAAWWKAAP